jgi:uncharacterized protein (DUF2384 family)
MTSRSNNPITPPTATDAFQFSHRNAGNQAELIRLYGDTFHLTRAMLSDLTGMTFRSPTKSRRRLSSSPKQEKALSELDRLLVALSRIMQPTEIGPWLARPHPAFDKRSPLNLVQDGEQDRIWRMLYDLSSGQPG